jgi:hypothetical protein
MLENQQQVEFQISLFQKLNGQSHFSEVMNKLRKQKISEIQHGSLHMG